MQTILIKLVKLIKFLKKNRILLFKRIYNKDEERMLIL